MKDRLVLSVIYLSLRPIQSFSHDFATDGPTLINDLVSYFGFTRCVLRKLVVRRRETWVRMIIDKAWKRKEEVPIFGKG